MDEVKGEGRERRWNRLEVYFALIKLTKVLLCI